MADDKAARLAQIAGDIRDLETSPLYEYRQENGFLPVPGEGDPGAAIVFVGEAPGKREAQTGRPFVGAAGRILDGLLDSVGLDRGEVYITNIVKDRPPDNRDPTREEIDIYAPFLRRQLDVIQPRVVVTLGRFAMRFMLDVLGGEAAADARGARIGDLHGQQIEGTLPYGRVTLVPLYHPAAGLYNPGLKETMREDFRGLAGYVDGCSVS